jgi:hypothetical protein
MRTHELESRSLQRQIPYACLKTTGIANRTAYEFKSVSIEICMPGNRAKAREQGAGVC